MKVYYYDVNKVYAGNFVSPPPFSLRFREYVLKLNNPSYSKSKFTQVGFQKLYGHWTRRKSKEHGRSTQENQNERNVIGHKTDILTGIISLIPRLSHRLSYSTFRTIS